MWQDDPTNPYYSGYYPQYPLTPVPVRRKKSWRGWLALALVSGLLAYFGPGLYNQFGSQLGITLPGTSSEQESSTYQFVVPPNDPLYNKQYALQHLNATEAWKTTTGSSNIVVAVVDTGVDPTHPALKGKLVDGYNFVDGNRDTSDTVGHGTFVASLIAANGDNNAGIVGLAPGVKIMPLKVMDQRSGSSLAINQAIRYATDHGARVINLSLGSPVPSSAIRQSVSYALSHNVVVVASAGNEAGEGNPVEYPASFSGVISVGATGPTDTIASFSNHNQAVSLVAPGVNVLGARSARNTICRPYLTSNYCIASGTSFSAPYVSAAAALLLSKNPRLTPAQVKSNLTSSATDLGRRGTDTYYGAGLLNPAKALQAA